MYHILNTKGPAASSKEIVSQFNVIMIAGGVTTATFLTATMYYLGHNIQARERLQNEIRRTFSSIDVITSKNLMDCAYLNAVIEEGLRIHPPAGAGHLSRIVPRGGCEISGRYIPEGVGFSLDRRPSSQRALTPLLPFSLPSHVRRHAELVVTPRPEFPSIHGPSCATPTTSTIPPVSSRSAGCLTRRRARKAIS